MNFTQLKRKALREIKEESTKTEQGIPYLVFRDAPNTLRPTQQDKGKRVWLAGHPRTSKFRLLDFDEKNEYFIVDEVGAVPKRYVFKEEILLHPKEWTKEKLDELQ